MAVKNKNREKNTKKKLLLNFSYCINKQKYGIIQIPFCSCDFSLAIIVIRLRIALEITFSIIKI